MAVGKKTGGRTKGTPNKATADIKALARDYTPKAMARLVRVIDESDSDAAVVSAIKELFDRGYGKARQSVELDGSLAVEMVHRIEMVGVRPSADRAG